MRAAGAFCACLAVGLLSGAWGCNAVLGINDPIHATDAGSLAPLDASSKDAEGGADTSADTSSGDSAESAIPEASQETGDGQLDEGSVDALADTLEEPDAAACGKPGQPCCAGSCSTGECCSTMCVDLATDKANCGSCGKACSLGCLASSCVAPVQIGVADEFTCVVLSDETMRCWGRGIEGQLGNGAYDNQTSPVVVLSDATTVLKGAQKVSGGFKHTCALLADKTLRCWGKNSSGQLGNKSYVSTDLANTSPELTPVTDVDTGSDHACALSGGSLWCWGKNSYNQASPSVNNDVPVPFQVDLVAPTQAALGYQHSCASLQDGSVKCWGYNYSGQLGDGTYVDKDIPVPVQQCPAPGLLSGVQSLATGARHSCGIKVDKSVWCWGDGTSGQAGNNKAEYNTCAVQTVNMPDATKIVAGTGHVCAIVTGNDLYCWGSNTNGQVGDKSNLDVTTPTKVLDNVLDVGAGDGHTCVIRINGTVMCWGDNGFGQLGDGTKTPNMNPVTVNL